MYLAGVLPTVLSKADLRLFREPFPYRVRPADGELTMTVDQISSGGFGDVCGVAVPHPGGIVDNCGKLS